MPTQLAASPPGTPVARSQLQAPGAQWRGYPAARVAAAGSGRYEHPAVRAEHEAAVRRAILGMHEMLYETMRLEDAAAAAIYSRFHFHRTFRQITSTTPARFLASLRMQRAKQLLATSDLTVTSISGMVGYESLGTFTTQFGRLVGLSPGRFRRLLDACGELRLSELDLGAPTSGRLPLLCTAPSWARLECRTTIIGLFESELPSGSPTGFTMLRNRSSADIASPGGRSVLAVSVPDDIRLSELAIGSMAGALVGRAVVPGGQPGSGVLDLQLRLPRLVDPPVVSAAAVQHLVGRR